MGLIDDTTGVLIDFLEEAGEEVQQRASPATETVGEGLSTGEDFLDALVRTVDSDDQAAEEIAELVERTSLNDEAAGVIVDLIEETLLASLQNEGQLTPENVEGPVDDLEGSAVGLGVGLNVLALLVEAIPLEDIDLAPQEIIQILSFAQLDDLTGREIQARLQEGADPALKQLVHTEHRSKQADFQDFTEAALRLKEVDGEIETRGGDIPAEFREQFAAADFDYLPDPDTYGTIPDQTPLYELVGLEHLEPEEILEEGPQKGVIPSPQAVNQILKLSGLPEDVQQVYREIRDSVAESQDVYQEKTRVGEVVFEVDQAILDGRITPDEAVTLLESDIRDVIDLTDAEGGLPPRLEGEPDPADTILEELRRKFQLLDSISEDGVSLTDAGSFYRRGVISSQEFQQLYREGRGPPGFLSSFIREEAIRQGPSDIQEAHALGRISTSDARFRLSLIGFSEGEAADILSGTDPDTLLQERLQEGQAGGAIPTGTVVEIGDTREALLRAVGIESVEELAALDVDQLTEITGMTDDEATRALTSADRILEAQ